MMAVLALLLQNVFRHLKVQWRCTCDPYFEHVNALIRYYIVPYGSVADMKAGRVDRRRLLRIGFYVSVTLVNIGRFGAIALAEKADFVRRYLFVFFAGSANLPYMYLTVVVAFLTPTILYLTVAVMSMTPGSYNGIEILFEIVERGSFGYPARYQKVMDRGMRLLYRLINVFSVCSPVSLVLVPYLDFFSRRSLWSLSAVDVLLLAGWTVSLMISLRQLIVISMLLIQQAYFLTVHYSNQLEYAKARFSRALRQKFGKRKCSCLCFVRVDNITPKIVRLHRSLTRIMASFLKGQSQIKGLSYVLFLALLFSLQFQAYILLDFRTSSVVRTVVLSELPFMGLLIFTNFYLMSQLNVKSKRILPQLDCCLHRLQWPRSQVVFKLTLMETRASLAEDGVAVKLGDIHRVTRLQVLATFRLMLADLFLH